MLSWNAGEAIFWKLQTFYLHSGLSNKTSNWSVTRIDSYRCCPLVDYQSSKMKDFILKNLFIKRQSTKGQVRSSMSTVLRGDPFCFLTTTILCCHSTGSSGGTSIKMPILTFLSNCCFIVSFQCTGIVAGVWIALGSVPSFSVKCNGGLDISGSGWWEHMFIVDEE